MWLPIDIKDVHTTGQEASYLSSPMSLSLEEALDDFNKHFKHFGSFGVMVQPEQKMNHDTNVKVKEFGQGEFFDYSR